MAQVGDTITYTYSDGESVAEDISSVSGIEINYVDGAGGVGGTGFSNAAAGGDGGRVENVTINVSNKSTLYLWVGGTGDRLQGGLGRYEGGAGAGPSYPSGGGAGSTEISFSIDSQNTVNDDDLPVLVGAGGGGGGGSDTGEGGGAARGASGFNSGGGLEPPLGGDGGLDGDTPGGDGYGYIDDRSVIISEGTTTQGGGSAGGGAGENGTDGEIQISYVSLAPSAPSNVAITDAQTEGELTVDWDTVSDATGYYVYRAESSASAKSDYTQVADVSSPPYVDQNLEDGERYYYRVSAYN